MQKLSCLYTKLAIVYQHKQNKDEDEAKRLAYVAIRNVLGAIGFFCALTLFSILDIFLFSITSEVSLSRYRLQAYAIAGILIFSYILLAKRFLLPRLQITDSVQVTDINLKKYNRIYIGLIFFIGIFGGLMFVVNRLLYIYF